MSEIRQLLDHLAAGDPAVVDGALARLTVLGTRAVEPALEVYPISSPHARALLLVFFEQVQDARTVPLLEGVLGDTEPARRRQAMRALARQRGPRVLASLLGALREERDPAARAELLEILACLAAAGEVEVLDPVLAVLFDPNEPPRVRRMGLMALSAVRPRQARRLLSRLAGSPSDPLAAEAASVLAAGGDRRALGLALTRDEAPQDGATPGIETDPAGVERWLARLAAEGDDAGTRRRCRWALTQLGVSAQRRFAERLDGSGALPVLDAALEVLAPVQDRVILVELKRLALELGARCLEEIDPQRAGAMAAAHGRVHLSIARAGSRLAVGDLKEGLRNARGAPDDLVRALGLVGRGEDLPDLLMLARRSGGAPEAALREAMGAIRAREGGARFRRAVAALPRELLEALQRIDPEMTPRPVSAATGVSARPVGP